MRGAQLLQANVMIEEGAEKMRRVVILILMRPDGTVSVLQDVSDYTTASAATVVLRIIERIGWPLHRS